MQGSSDEAITTVIREGIPNSAMIPWKDVLSDEQIRSLVIQVRKQEALAASGAILEKVKPLGGVLAVGKVGRAKFVPVA